MAQLYTQDGAVVRVDLSDEAPAGACEFDPTTNPELAHLLSQSVAGWTVVDGALARDGLAVSVNSPGHAYSDRQAVGAALAVLETGAYPANEILIPALRALLRAVSH